MLRILQAKHALLPHQRRIASFWQFVDVKPPLFYESKKCYQPKRELIQEKVAQPEKVIDAWMKKNDKLNVNYIANKR